ncbi:Hpt domain-containing protein [Geobacter grbiciae]|uniref:Hpt domain-containing protein n=1 Tax=Geobacter grbiciae TaxID=155042 RepID=UPI001FEAA3A7|nr:Hpt domain-containing protein [Geobacter grbiciae]
MDRDNVPDKIVVVCDPELEDIIPAYLEGRKTEGSVIRELAVNGQFDEVRTIAHGLKGSGGCYGFSRITEIGRDMELAANDGNLVEVLKQLDTLEAYLQAIEVRYE